MNSLIEAGRRAAARGVPVFKDATIWVRDAYGDANLGRANRANLTSVPADMAAEGTTIANGKVVRMPPSC